jgi:hypothetical protein
MKEGYVLKVYHLRCFRRLSRKFKQSLPCAVSVYGFLITVPTNRPVFVCYWFVMDGLFVCDFLLGTLDCYACKGLVGQCFGVASWGNHVLFMHRGN